MKPRIVYECTHGYHTTKPDRCEHNVHLLLPWPEACPYTPEAVMAACERAGLGVHSRPHYDVREWWVFVESVDDPAPYPQILDHKFMAEPCKHGCEHPTGECWVSSHGGVYSKRSVCGAILSDRRTGNERRKSIGRRLASNNRFGNVGGRRSERDSRRSGRDRRRAK